MASASAVRPDADRHLHSALMALLFAVSLIAYADRQILALLKPVLDRLLGWRSGDYGAMTTAFQACVAGTLVFAGWLVDKVGVRTGYAIGLGGWSLAATLHAACRTVGQFTGARAMLGGFEAIGLPAGIKAVAVFFPQEQRGLMMGVLNMAPNIAAMTTPLLASALYVAVGWKWTIALIGASGFVCLAIWLALPLRRLEQTMALPVARPMPDGGPVLRDRGTWAVAAAKLLSDQAWWFFLFWLPDFFHRRYGLDLRHLGPPVAAIYAMAASGALLGGLATDRLTRRTAMGRPRARRAVMGAAALLVLPIALVPHVDGLWWAVVLVGLGLAAHQAFSTNVFAFAGDWFSPARLGRAISFGALCGNLGGTATLWLAGRLINNPAAFQWMFLGCALGYPLAWLMMQALVPAGRQTAMVTARPS